MGSGGTNCPAAHPNRPAAVLQRPSYPDSGQVGDAAPAASAEKLLGADYASESAYHSGELQNRLFSDVQLISTTLTSLLPNLVNMVTQLIAAAAVMLTLDWAFTLLLAGAGTLLFW